MKKTIFSILTIAFAFTANAQEGGKKVEAGLNYQMGFGLNKPTTKLMESGGLGLSNSIGLTLNFAFSEKIGLSTGIEFDFESIKYKTAQDSTFYTFNDTDILQKEDVVLTDPAQDLYMLEARKYKTVFVTIPTMLIFKMKPLGAFTPYGKFGARTSVLVKSTVNDEGTLFDTPITPTTVGVAKANEGMSTKGDLFFLRSQIGIGGGTSWEFSGGTSVFAELTFFYGFTPLFYGNAITGDDEERDMHLFNPSATSTNGRDYFTNKATQKHIALKIGILF
jgi:hypothetical protein